MITTKEMIQLYQDFINYFLCIPVLMGEKTIGERFPGAENTFTVEALMQDGQILQCATSHYLGSGFAKIFDIKYQNSNNQYDYVHQTSAGLSTRIIGAVIMSHADDKGLVLPLGIAPNQIAILPIMAQKEIKVKEVSNLIYSQLKNKYRVIVDESDSGFGYKVANQEVLGTPIVIAIGPKDVNDNTITLIRRDDGIKQTIKNNDLLKTIDAQLHDYNINIYKNAEKRLNASIVEVNNLDDFIKAITDRKIVKAP
jgi:prolyl-tRNA synthetase